MADNKHDDNNAPTTPHVGDADPCAEPQPASPEAEKTANNVVEIHGVFNHTPPPEEKIFQDIPPTSCELASGDASLDLATFEAMDAEILADIDDLADRFKVLKQEFRDKIVPKIYAMWEFLSQRGSMHGVASSSLPEWSVWRDRCIAILKKKMQMSKSTLERELKLLRDDQGGESEPEPEPEPEPPVPLPAPVEDPVEQLKKHCKQLGLALADGNTDHALELTENLALAINDGLLDDREPAQEREPCIICNYKPDDPPPAFSTLLQILKDVAFQLCREPYHLGGIAEDIDTIREHLEDRVDLDKRMDKLRERMTKRPAGFKPNEDMLMLQLRRDRRFLVDMQNIKAAGGTTYRGEKIWGSGDELFIKRYTRDDIEWELDNSEPFGIVSSIPEDDERLGHLPRLPMYETINPILTKLPVPAPSTSDEPFAVKVHGAFIAASRVSNAVAQTDIQPRYRSNIVFYTNRKTMKLRKFLQEHGMEFNLKYHLWKGKNCFRLEYDKSPLFKTKEEATAYEEGFRTALLASFPDVEWGEPPSSGNPG